MLSNLMTLSPLNPLLALLTPPTGEEYMALIPGAIVSMLAMVIILVDSFHRPGSRRDYLAYFSAIGLGLAGLSVYALWDNSLSGATFSGMLYLDRFSLFFAALACLGGALACLQAPSYMRLVRMDRGEFYMLVLFSVAGAIFMASSADMLTLFISLEVMSIPVYCLAGYLRRDGRSAESAMKYFVLGAFSAGLMLYGMALLYGVTGTTNLEYIGRNLAILISDPAAAGASGNLITVSMLLIFSGFAFKIAAVPFHVWTPDVYTGSPSPAVGFMSTIVKAGALAAMLRVLLVAFEHPLLRGGFDGIGWLDVVFFCSAASMILGNVVAIMQHNVKRMLAYSSIAHAGYLLIGVAASSAAPEFFLHHDTVLFYLLTYSVGSLGAFGVLSVLGKNGRPVETYEDLSGLGLKYPVAGVLMGVFMFSNAGVPPLAGFVGKLYIFSSAVQVGNATDEFAFIGLAIVGVLSSVAGAYYYLRVLVAMYMRPAEQGARTELMMTGPAKLSLFVCALLTLLLGVLPGRALELAREGVVDFQGVGEQTRLIQLQGAVQLELMEQQQGEVDLLVVPVPEEAAEPAAPAAVEVEPPARRLPPAALDSARPVPGGLQRRLAPQIAPQLRPIQRAAPSR